MAWDIMLWFKLLNEILISHLMRYYVITWDIKLQIFRDIYKIILEEDYKHF